MTVRWTVRAADRVARRQLSARLTEGLSYRNIDILTNSTKVPADFIVRNSDNRQTVAFQKICTLHIFF